MSSTVDDASGMRPATSSDRLAPAARAPAARRRSKTPRACILHPGAGSEQLATLVAEVVATARTLAA